MASNDFESILAGKYPARLHLTRVLEHLSKKGLDNAGILYLEGRRAKLLEDSDSEEPFRQRRHFYYLTGCNLPDCHFLYDVLTAKSILFIPAIDPEEVIWSGPSIGIEEALQAYDVDEVRFATEVNPMIATASSHSVIYTIDYEDGPTLHSGHHMNTSILRNAIEACRVVKDEYEVAAIRKANVISSSAHVAVMEKARGASNEMELEAKFLERCVAQGAKKMAYDIIAASGRAAATLHYGRNDALLTRKQNVLMDAGAEWNNYAADITRTFPISGKFTRESRDIYDIVLQMQTKCIAQIMEGANWDDIHLLAHKIAIRGLLNIGILRGDPDEILEAETSVAFFPHGLGHYLGLDTHDVGGGSEGNDKSRIFRYLRKRGSLPAGSVVTVEPGVYFCEALIRPYLDDPKHSKFINPEVLERYWEVGGIRIEDNVLVIKNGCEILTTVPKEVHELEAMISRGT